MLATQAKNDTAKNPVGNKNQTRLPLNGVTFFILFTYINIWWKIAFLYALLVVDLVLLKVSLFFPYLT
jgi:hypothetical protein